MAGMSPPRARDRRPSVWIIVRPDSSVSPTSHTMTCGRSWRDAASRWPSAAVAVAIAVTCARYCSSATVSISRASVWPPTASTRIWASIASPSDELSSALDSARSERLGNVTTNVDPSCSTLLTVIRPAVELDQLAHERQAEAEPAVAPARRRSPPGGTARTSAAGTPPRCPAPVSVTVSVSDRRAVA